MMFQTTSKKTFCAVGDKIGTEIVSIGLVGREGHRLGELDRLETRLLEMVGMIQV